MPVYTSTEMWDIGTALWLTGWLMGIAYMAWATRRRS